MGKHAQQRKIKMFLLLFHEPTRPYVNFKSLVEKIKLFYNPIFFEWTNQLNKQNYVQQRSVTRRLNHIFTDTFTVHLIEKKFFLSTSDTTTR